MTSRLRRAIEAGYMERRSPKGIDPDFDAYWNYCCSVGRPFVRIERRHGRRQVEADLFSTNRVFTEDLQKQALDLLEVATPNPKKARFGFGSLIVSCDGVATNQANEVAKSLFHLASTAPYLEPQT